MRQKNLFGHHSGHQDLFKFIDHFEFISRFDERCADANHTQSVRVKPGINNNYVVTASTIPTLGFASKLKQRRC